MAYVYRHIRVDKNVPFYIGVGTKDDPKYTRAYFTPNRSDYWWSVASVTKFEVEIIMDDISLEDAYKKETEFISLYGREDLGKGTLVNRSDGGLGCVNGITKETREKMAAKLRGRPLPKWQRDILSKAAIGKEIPSRRVPISQYNLKGVFIRNFESINIASKELSLHQSLICKVLNGERKKTGGFIFKYLNK